MNARPVAISILVLLAAGAGAQDAAPTLDAAFQSLPEYVVGNDAQGLEAIRAEVNRVYGAPGARDALVGRLTAVLDGEATPEAKLFVCRQLLVIGTAGAVPSLAKLLCDPATVDEARYALERLEAPEAGTALRATLGPLTGNARIGVINSLGVRRDAEAAPALVALIDQDDTETALAAVEALTRIGDAAACEALQAHLDDSRPTVKMASEDGVLACAECTLAAGALEDASGVYERLYHPNRRDAVRVAAFRGMVQARPDDACALVKSALMGDDAPVALAALRFVRAGATPAAVASGWLADLTAERKGLAIDALADRGDAAALPAMVAVVRHPDDDASMHAALRALGVLGDRTAIPVLARTATGDDSNAAELAMASLVALKGSDIDRVMMTAARAGDDDIAKVLIQALGARQASDVSADIIDTFARNYGKPDVRKEALRALAKIAKPEQLDDLIAILVSVKKDDIQVEAQRAVVAAAARAEGTAKTAAILDALPDAKRPYSRAALIAVLGNIGDLSGLGAVRAALQDGDEEVRDAAVRAVSEWPGEGVMEDLAA